MGFIYLGMSDEDKAVEAEAFRQALAEYLEIDPTRLAIDIELMENDDSLSIQYEIQLDGDIPPPEVMKEINEFCEHNVAFEEPAQA